MADLHPAAGRIPAPRRPSEAMSSTELVAVLASGRATILELAGHPGTWAVRCGSTRYTILTRVAGLPPATHVVYAVIDWRRAIAGTCALIGGTWRDGTFSDQDCQLMLAALAAGVITVRPDLSAPLHILRTTPAEETPMPVVEEIQHPETGQFIQLEAETPEHLEQKVADLLIDVIDLG